MAMSSWPKASPSSPRRTPRRPVVLLANVPSLMLLDIMMPDIDGIEACQRFRKQIGERAPILFLTASDTVDILLAAFKAGGDDFVVNTSGLAKLVERVKYWRDRRRAATARAAAKSRSPRSRSGSRRRQRKRPSPNPVPNNAARCCYAALALCCASEPAVMPSHRHKQFSDRPRRFATAKKETIHRFPGANAKRRNRIALLYKTFVQGSARLPMRPTCRVLSHHCSPSFSRRDANGAAG